MRTASQRAIPKERFVRALGRAPLLRSPRVAVIDRFDLFTETFGPPERRSYRGSTVLVWNFIRIDRNDSATFSLSSRIPADARISGGTDIEADIVAKSGATGFVDWALDRLRNVANGEGLPGFVGARPSAITRL
jgi:hypothetical protein